MMDSRQPIACNLGQLGEVQRAREQFLLSKMLRSRLETQERTTGYAVRLPADSLTILEVAEFILLERICCPFLDFELRWEAGENTLWLQLSGPEGVKSFLNSVFRSEPGGSG